MLANYADLHHCILSDALQIEYFTDHLCASIGHIFIALYATVTVVLKIELLVQLTN